jgi:D-sedoheptulose 7-phosphate isomerase
MPYIEDYLNDAVKILKQIDTTQIENIIKILCDVRDKKARLFLLGVGGSAANCSHAVNDFRKINGIEAYTPVDNVGELTARTNDEGFNTVFSEWLKDSHLRDNDCVFVFSVGGGSKEKNISANIVYALEYAKEVKAKIVGVVGRDGGYTKTVADACVIIPPLNPDSITPHTEAFQGVIWHLIVSDPRLMRMKNKWESVTQAK